MGKLTFRKTDNLKVSEIVDLQRKLIFYPGMVNLAFGGGGQV